MPHVLMRVPAQITVLGGVAVFVAEAVLLYQRNVLGAVAPSGWFAMSAAVFFYMTMDAIDGKQARRTNTSSPLGDIMDHGTDVLVMGAVTVGLATMLGIVDRWTFLPLMLMGQLSCYLYQWEMSYTRTCAAHRAACARRPAHSDART